MSLNWNWNNKVGELNIAQKSVEGYKVWQS